MQVCSDFGCYLLRVDKVVRFVFSNQQVADNDWIAVHIAAAQIQGPCYFVEGREQQAVGFGFLHLGTYGFQFLGTGTSGIFRVVDKGRGLWHFRSPVPYLFHRISGAFECYSVVFQFFLE